MGYQNAQPSMGTPTPAGAPQMTPDQQALANQFAPGGFGVGSAGGSQLAPNDNYGQTNQQLQAMQNLFNQSVYGPTMAIGNQQIGNLFDQIGLTGAGADLQSQIAQQGADFSLQGIGLQQEGLGVRQGALQRQMALLPQQYGLQNQGFDLSQAQAEYGAGEQRRSLDSSETAKGAFTSIGANQGRSDIAQQLAFSEQGIGLQRQGAALNFKEQQAQQQDASKMLDISAKQLGLNKNEVTSRLQNALNQIGIGSQVSTDQLLSEMYKVQQGEISPMSQLFSQIYQMSGITMPGGTHG